MKANLFDVNNMRNLKRNKQKIFIGVLMVSGDSLFCFYSVMLLGCDLRESRKTLESRSERKKNNSNMPLRRKRRIFKAAFSLCVVPSVKINDCLLL